MLILQTIARQGRLHGFEIAEEIKSRSENILQVEEGSLYPALQRLLLKDWIHGEWGKTTENRRARYYTLTQSGKEQLSRELNQYQQVSLAIRKVIQPA